MGHGPGLLLPAPGRGGFLCRHIRDSVLVTIASGSEVLVNVSIKQSSQIVENTLLCLLSQSPDVVPRSVLHQPGKHDQGGTHSLSF